jgi:predicted glycosyltransferase
LRIKTRLGRLIENVVQKRNYHYINKFTECWVPDTEKDFTLAGELSHPKKLPAIPVKYIGLLSKFEKADIPVRKDHLVIILSGPEPQRTLLEDKMIRELGNYSATATVVRGLPGTETMIPSTNMIRFYNHLPAEELNQEINSANYVISRSGYSTVMDLVKLKKKSILISTPGQPEQEYLQKWLEEKKIAPGISQKNFSLGKALQRARNFEFQFPAIDKTITLGSTVADFIELVMRRRINSGR